MDIKNQKEYFNNTYKKWKEISNEKDIDILDKLVKKYGLGESVIEDGDFFYFSCTK